MVKVGHRSEAFTSANHLDTHTRTGRLPSFNKVLYFKPHIVFLIY
jgi:hypothetical protein